MNAVHYQRMADALHFDVIVTGRIAFWEEVEQGEGGEIEESPLMLRLTGCTALVPEFHNRSGNASYNGLHFKAIQSYS
jgi:hypothetical protein